MAVQISGNDITVPRDGSFTRNVTIGGTLTYEDVTNIDSVGLVTARTGIEIGASPGVGASISVDGNAIFSGITTVGTGLSMGDNVRANFGDGGDLQIYHSGAVDMVESTSTYLILEAPNTIIRNLAGDESYAKFFGNDSVELYFDGSKKFNTKSDGVLVTGELQTTTLDCNGNAHIDGTLQLTNDLFLGDNDEINVGSSNDLKIFHNGTRSKIQNETGDFRITGNDIKLKNFDDDETYITCVDDGAVDLYHNNVKAFSTTQYGVQVESFGSDSSRIQFATSGHTYSQIGYFGLNRFSIDTHDGLEVRDASASYATRMKIDENGRFNVNAGGSLALQTNHHCIQNSNATSWAMQAVNTASLGYGVEIRVNAATASREALYIYSTADSQSKAAILSNGTFNSRTNNYGSLSDVKLKENIVDASSQWNDLKAIKVRNFNFISDTSNTKLIGVVAQELETVCPSLIENISDKEINGEGERVETGTSTKNVKYSILYMKAIKTLQEAQTRIETLESRLDAAGL